MDTLWNQTLALPFDLRVKIISFLPYYIIATLTLTNYECWIIYNEKYFFKPYNKNIVWMDHIIMLGRMELYFQYRPTESTYIEFGIDNIDSLLNYPNYTINRDYDKFGVHEISTLIDGYDRLYELSKHKTEYKIQKDIQALIKPVLYSLKYSNVVDISKHRCIYANNILPNDIYLKIHKLLAGLKLHSVYKYGVLLYYSRNTINMHILSNLLTIKLIGMSDCEPHKQDFFRLMEILDCEKLEQHFFKLMERRDNKAIPENVKHEMAFHN